MKIIFTIISALGISCTIAQTATNYDFEAWTTLPATSPAPAYDDPNNWNSLNSLTSAIGSITCFKATAAADVHSGNSAVKLVTKLVLTTMANGLLTTGTPHASPPGVDGGVPYTLRPDSIIGWYKYTPTNVDRGFVEIQLLGAGGITDTIGYAIFRTPNASVNTYTHFAEKITYRNSNPVVKSIWIISASESNTVHYANSTLFIDDIQLGSNTWLGTTGINETLANNLTVSPNPAGQYITVKNPGVENAVFNLMDGAGRIVVDEKINSTQTSIDLANVTSGVYLYTIKDANGLVIKSDKIIVQK